MSLVQQIAYPNTHEIKTNVCWIAAHSVCVSGFMEKLQGAVARPPHEPPAILPCTPGLAGYPFDPTQLWHG